MVFCFSSFYFNAKADVEKIEKGITILSNTLVTFLQTFEQLRALFPVFKDIEYLTLFIFCIAYLGVGVVAIPTGIISAGFVEQYQRKSSVINIREEDIKEIAEIFIDHRYAGKTIEEMEEIDHIKIFLILREELSILPQKDTVLKRDDIVVIRGEG